MIFALVMMSACSGGDESGGCGKVKNVGFQVEATSVSLYFEAGASANSFRIEYGPTGFAEGTGTIMTTSSNYPQIQGLNPGTTYDFYIKTVCSADASGKSVKLSSVTTSPSQCTGQVDLVINQSSATSVGLYPTYDEGYPDHYEVEYGVQGFTLGTGTHVNLPVATTTTISNIQPSTAYDFYVKAVCYDTDGTAYKKIQYTTASSCPKPNNLGSTYIAGNCNAGTMVRNFYWYDDLGAADNYTISIVTNSSINNPDAGQQFTTSNTSIQLSNMFCNWEAFYVKSNCGGGSSSTWAGPFYW